MTITASLEQLYNEPLAETMVLSEIWDTMACLSASLLPSTLESLVNAVVTSFFIPLFHLANDPMEFVAVTNAIGGKFNV